MPTLRNIGLVLSLIVLYAPSGWTARRAAYVYSIDEFGNAALSKSLRSQTNQENLESSRLGWMSTRRRLTWPSLATSAEALTTYSDNDDGITSDTRSTEVGLSLRQPFLTGTSLSVSSSWEGSNTETDILGTRIDSRSREVPTTSVSLTQPLYLFTGNGALRTWRENNYRRQNELDTYRSESLNIEFEARSLYYNLLLQKEILDVESKKFDSSKMVNSITRTLADAGRMARVEVIRSDIRLKENARRLQNTETAYEQLLIQARDLLLLEPDAPIRLSSPLTYIPFNTPLEKLLEIAEKNNPSILSSERTIALSEIALRRTREENRPSLQAQGIYGRTRNRSDPLDELDPYSWQAGVSMEWPIFDATQTRLETKQAQISLANTKRRYESLTRDLRVRVKNAYLDIKRIEGQIQDFPVQKSSGEKNLNAMRLQFRNGLTRLTDVFDAENQLRQIEIEYLNLLVSYNLAVDRMKVLLGRSWN